MKEMNKDWLIELYFDFECPNCTENIIIDKNNFKDFLHEKCEYRNINIKKSDMVKVLEKFKITINEQIDCLKNEVEKWSFQK